MSTTHAIRYGTWNRRLLTLLGMGPARSSIRVDDDTVAVTMGWAFDATIPRDSIVAVEPDDDRVWGWGVHGWGGTWLVNGSSSGLVRIALDPAVPARTAFISLRLRTLRVSVDEPDALIAALT